MATAETRRRIRNRPAGTTIALTVVGYALVIGTFVFDVSVYPDLSRSTVDVLSHAIAGINATATVLLAIGWYRIRGGDVDGHRRAMIGAFALILLFLVAYLLKVGGGGTKEFVGPDPAYYAYLLMLAVHVVLSIVAVPVVLYALVLGLTRTPAELRRTAHARVGRVAAAAWITSLALGVVTYVLLNHVYDHEFAAMVVAARPA